MNSTMLKHSQTYLRNSSESNNSRYNKRLSSCSRTELSQLHEKNLQMLNNRYIRERRKVCFSIMLIHILVLFFKNYQIKELN